ncbi:hypothetical protein [Rhizobium glycinendophyticum]|uniref:hypothetical protein n=1 Tax=Rhizobium glycinendophyticum TaxID=2589807 RepID=UPI001FE6097F|nr:hypothetical protein [Rhizobium glycinendophyticum]
MNDTVKPAVVDEEDFHAAAESVLRDGETVADLIDRSIDRSIGEAGGGISTRTGGVYCKGAGRAQTHGSHWHFLQNRRSACHDARDPRRGEGEGREIAMSRKLHYSESFFRGMQRYYRQLAGINPLAADKAYDAVPHHLETLVDFPMIGRRIHLMTRQSWCVNSSYLLTGGLRRLVRSRERRAPLNPRHSPPARRRLPLNSYRSLVSQRGLIHGS